MNTPSGTHNNISIRELIKECNITGDWSAVENADVSNWEKKGGQKWKMKLNQKNTLKKKLKSLVHLKMKLHKKLLKA